jgi:crotonobetainyl-CoA:carnitine CoA-transferase CaiB-like acyl-CoA transferase
MTTTSAHGTAGKALRDIVVLDISSFLAAPMAATWLGDFGAEVVKVEHPKGDMLRSWGQSKNGIPLFWKLVSRNKKSLTLDLHTARGQELLRQLVAKADVLIENFRTGLLAQWQLDYESLAAINPGLVMLSVSTFGQTGPYSPRRGFGTLAEAMSGYAHLTGEENGPPLLPSFGLADGIAGLCGAYAVMVALHERDQSGRGQHIDLALYEPLLSVLGQQVVEFDQLGIVSKRLGSRLPFSAPRNIYQDRDGRWLAMSCSTQSVFERACKAIGQPELITDPRFGDNRSRMVNASQVDEIFQDWIGARSRDDVLDILNSAGAAAAPVYDVSEVCADPHFVERESIVTVSDPELGAIRMQNVVPRLSRTPGSVAHAGVPLGENTAEVLTALLNLTESELAELHEQGIV